MYVTISALKKKCSVRFYLQLCVEGILFTLFVVFNTYCVVFLLLFGLSTTYIWCNKCFQFFWIVYSCLPLRFL